MENKNYHIYDPIDKIFHPYIICHLDITQIDIILGTKAMFLDKIPFINKIIEPRKNLMLNNFFINAFSTKDNFNLSLHIPNDYRENNEVRHGLPLIVGLEIPHFLFKSTFRPLSTLFAYFIDLINESFEVEILNGGGTSLLHKINHENPIAVNTHLVRIANSKILMQKTENHKPSNSFFSSAIGKKEDKPLPKLILYNGEQTHHELILLIVNYIETLIAEQINNKPNNLSVNFNDINICAVPNGVRLNDFQSAKLYELASGDKIIEIT